MCISVKTYNLLTKIIYSDGKTNRTERRLLKYTIKSEMPALKLMACLFTPEEDRLSLSKLVMLFSLIMVYFRNPSQCTCINVCVYIKMKNGYTTVYKTACKMSGMRDLLCG